MTETHGAALDMRARVRALLESDLDRGALLRELSELVDERGFDACADLWGPALYQRDPDFYQRFLLRHLGPREADAIRELLPRAEADGRDELFHGLYARVTRPEAWNTELLALARSAEPDERVLAAVLRRRLSGYWFILDGEAALALYRRNPSLFGDFVAGSVRSGVAESDGTYSELLDEAKGRGDDEFYWRVFRQVADPFDWDRAARQLLEKQVPAEAILAELRRRHPVYARDLDAAVMADLLEKYGRAVLPYIEENADWISRKGAVQLLAAAERLGDEALYWRVFFRVGNSRAWNAALLKLAEQPLETDDWVTALRLRTPPANVTSHWSLGQETALALYRRDAEHGRPLIERWIDDVSVPLFEAAEQRGDEELLDLLTTRLVWDLAQVVYFAYPKESERQYRKPDPGSMEKLEQWGRMITARLDRLYAASPAIYVQHATQILSRLDHHSSWWSFPRNLDQNPVFTYLYRRHHAAWLSVPAAVREVLETPNQIAQGIALEILGEDLPEAADRTVENVALLRAMLLGESGRGLKKLVLGVLERAASRSPAYATAILPALHEILYFRARYAIADRAMVSYVRLQHQTLAETLPTALPAQP